MTPITANAASFCNAHCDHDRAHGFCTTHGEAPYGPDGGWRCNCPADSPARQLPSYVYVASSWRNILQPGIVMILQVAGIACYDFRNPPNASGFGWEEVMPGYVAGSESVLPGDYLAALEHPRAVEGFAADFAAMEKADTFVLVLPCGRSAHLELGWAVGAGKRTAILLEGPDEMVPELMYKMVDHIAPDVNDLLKWLGVGEA